MSKMRMTHAMSKFYSKKSKSESRFVRIVSKKIWCIKYKGGCCVKCNLMLIDKPWLAQFHHRDKDKKNFGIA